MNYEGQQRGKKWQANAVATHLRRCELIGAHDGIISTGGRSKASEHGGGAVAKASAIAMLGARAESGERMRSGERF